MGALAAAATDGASCLLVVLWGYLDVYEYRELKQSFFLARLRLAAGRRVDPANVRAYFGPSRTPVSVDVGHPFRSMSDT
jgi:hypothetical protein